MYIIYPCSLYIWQCVLLSFIEFVKSITLFNSYARSWLSVTFIRFYFPTFIWLHSLLRLNLFVTSLSLYRALSLFYFCMVFYFISFMSDNSSCNHCYLLTETTPNNFYLIFTKVKCFISTGISFQIFAPWILETIFRTSSRAKWTWKSFVCLVFLSWSSLILWKKSSNKSPRNLEAKHLQYLRFSSFNLYSPHIFPGVNIIYWVFGTSNESLLQHNHFLIFSMSLFNVSHIAFTSFHLHIGSINILWNCC